MLIAFSESLMLNLGLSFFLSGLICFSLPIWIFLRKFFLEKTVCIRIMLRFLASVHSCCAGKQGSQVSGFYVEPIVMGYGGCCIDGYCVGQWTSIMLI